MEKTDDIQHSELCHWGIKGMKWGIRRFQNKDGSLTPLGKKRAGQDDKEEETPEQRKVRLLKSTNAKELYENRDLLTTAEINERINRLDTEARLANIANRDVKTGVDYMNSASEKIGAATNLFKKVDDAYSTVSRSAIGKTVADKLGLEPPKKEFNIDKLWKNRNKLSDKEIQDISQRLANEKRIEDELKRREKNAKEDKAARDKAKLDDAKKQVAEYNRKLEEENNKRSDPYHMKGDSVIDNKVGTGNKTPKNTNLLEDKSKKNSTVELMRDEDVEIIPPDWYRKVNNTSLSTVNSTNTSAATSFIAGYLEEK